MAEAKKYALITGATSGIGYELAKCFAADGHHLILVARTQEDLDHTRNELVQTYKVDVVTFAKDLFDKDAPFQLYEVIKARGLHVEYLVNDAGQGQFGLFADSDIRRQQDIIQLNVTSLTVLTYHFMKEMIARNSGRILQVASIASELPGPWQAVYHGTKAYVLQLTEGLRQELRDTHVTITALMPGATDTDFFRKADMLDSKILETKLSDPEDVARDGYEALMKGEDKVISGFKNKVLVGTSHIMPDTMVAAQMDKMQGPKE